MEFTQVSERMIQHHLAPISCLNLQTSGVVTDGPFCVKSEQALYYVSFELETIFLSPKCKIIMSKENYNHHLKIPCLKFEQKMIPIII